MNTIPVINYLRKKTSFVIYWSYHWHIAFGMTFVNMMIISKNQMPTVMSVLMLVSLKEGEILTLNLPVTIW